MSAETHYKTPVVNSSLFVSLFVSVFLVKKTVVAPGGVYWMGFVTK